MVFRDYYNILGILPGCSQKEIRDAWRRMASDSHPDKHPDNSDDSSRFLEVKEAYDVLGNPASRKEYDQNYAQRDKSLENIHFSSLWQEADEQPDQSNRLIDELLNRFFGIGTPRSGKQGDGAQGHIHYDDML